MTEATGMEAKTIHRLLEFNPAEGYKRNDEVKPCGFTCGHRDEPESDLNRNIGSLGNISAKSDADL